MTCQAEMCGNWTGDGCICEVMGLEPAVNEPLNYTQGDRSFDAWAGMGES